MLDEFYKDVNKNENIEKYKRIGKKKHKYIKITNPKDTKFDFDSDSDIDFDINIHIYNDSESDYDSTYDSEYEDTSSDESYLDSKLKDVRKYIIRNGFILILNQNYEQIEKNANVTNTILYENHLILKQYKLENKLKKCKLQQSRLKKRRLQKLQKLQKQ